MAASLHWSTPSKEQDDDETTSITDSWHPDGRGGGRASRGRGGRHLVLRSGEHISGDLVDFSASGFTVRVGGQTRTFGVGQVAVVDFTGGTSFPANEVDQAGGEHLLVLTNGQMIKGRLVDVGGSSPLRITFAHSGSNHDYMSNGIARIYFARPTAARRRFPAASRRPRDLRRRRVGFASAGRAGWVNTGLQVSQGQTLLFNTTGEVRLSTAGDDVAGPAGSKKGRYAPELADSVRPGWRARSAGSAPGRRLRIGNQTSIPSPGSGMLWLAVNDDVLGDNAGEFGVEITAQGRDGRLISQGSCPWQLPCPPRASRAARGRRPRPRASKASAPLKYNPLFYARLESHAEPASHRVSDEGQPAGGRTGNHRGVGEDRSLSAAARAPCGRAEIRPARRAALCQRANPPGDRAQQDPQGPRRQGPVHGGVRRPLPPGIRLSRAADRAQGRPRAWTEEAADGAGGLSPGVPRLRRALHRRDDRGIPAARGVRRLAEPVPDDELQVPGGHCARAREVRGARARLQGQETRSLVHPLPDGAGRG